MASDVTSYTLDEVKEKYGLSYYVEDSQIRNFMKKFLEGRKDIKVEVKSFIKGSTGHYPSGKVFNSKESAIKYAVDILNIKRNILCVQYISEIEFIIQYAYISFGILFFFKEYRNTYKSIKHRLKIFDSKSKKIPETIGSFFNEDNITVIEQDEYIISDVDGFEAYYFHKGYEHIDDKPSFATIQLKRSCFHYENGVYYTNFVADKIEGEIKERNRPIIEKHGFVYGNIDSKQDENAKEISLYSFDDRTKIYKNKEDVEKAINSAIDTTSNRLSELKDIKHNF